MEDFTTDSALALANDVAYCVVIPVQVKRIGAAVLRDQGLSKQSAHLRLFAVGLFLLLKDHLNDFDYVIVDMEFIGHERWIEEMVLHLIWRGNPTFGKHRLSFRHIGKQSPAHDLAWAVHARRAKPNKIISRRELLSTLK